MAKIKSSILLIVGLILGYTIAAFQVKATKLKIAANTDHPDTVYVFKDSLKHDTITIIKRVSAYHAPIVQKNNQREPELFDFNPNTVSREDLARLGFQEKDINTIIHAREKGFKYKVPEDFADCWGVSAPMYVRLKPYIKIPKIDINTADTAQLVYIKWVGAKSAAKIVEYRERLKGFSCTEQLMDILYKFDQERYDDVKDYIFCSEVPPFSLWTATEDELSLHPWIGPRVAKSIKLYKQHNDTALWTPERLIIAGIIKDENIPKFKRCRFAAP